MYKNTTLSGLFATSFYSESYLKFKGIYFILAYLFD